ncbi:protein KTI12 homolog [Gastrophryne carolinensis]
MPLVVLCGFPCSGKSRRALELKAHLEQNGRKVTIIGDHMLDIDKNAVYAESRKEKDLRGALRAEVERNLNKENVVILDSLNYIKGYRYELFCLIKHAQTPHCLIYCVTAPDISSAWNQDRHLNEQYTRDIFDALILRFEAPDSRNRWDSPLFTVQKDDALPLEQICNAIFHRKAPPPNQSTQTQPLSSTNFLHELDKVTQEVVTIRMAECEVQAVELPSSVVEDTVQPQGDSQQKQLPPLCRFYSQGRYCQFGRRCRFLHQRPNQRPPGKTVTPKVVPNIADQTKPEELPSNPSNNEMNPTPPNSRTNFENKHNRNKRLCRYFASGFCAMEANCRFWHPQKLPPLRDQRPVSKNTAPKDKAERLPVRPEEIKLVNVTPELAAELRKTEVSQLLKRFPKDKVIIQEREDGKVTYYRVTVEPTDPDWPFDLKELEILLEFPDDYPLQVFTIQIPEDQVLPSVMGRHVCETSKAWLEAKHATNQLIGKVELLFRPFLLWLDRNMERLFTEGARMYKQDITAEKAGLEFVPYQQLQVSLTVKSGEEAELQVDPVEEEDDSDSWTSCDDDEDDDLEPGPSTDGMKNVEGGGGLGPKKGTEIRFLGLKLGEGVGTLTAYGIVVSLQCRRCNVTADLALTEKQPCIAQCDKCNSRISGTFYPTVLHQYSTVLGYVDIQGAAAKDLVLLECSFLVGCLNCSQEESVKNLTFGVTKDLNCLKCHSKLSILTEAVRFQKVERYPNKATGKDQLPYGRKKIRDPAIQSGKPLPDHGACKHYRKSCRWFRFPCCGKAYPCDICHDEAEDHEMELATRMLCGYCAKEQPFNSTKPCMSCGSSLNKNIQSIHWEGGKGCRNKVKMSRKDKQKYSNSSKTVSRKSVAKK